MLLKNWSLYIPLEPTCHSNFSTWTYANIKSGFSSFERCKKWKMIEEINLKLHLVYTLILYYIHSSLIDVSNRVLYLLKKRIPATCYHLGWKYKSQHVIVKWDRMKICLRTCLTLKDFEKYLKQRGHRGIKLHDFESDIETCF